MTKLNDIYRCEVCGNIVEVVGEGFGELICCSKPMDKLTPNTDDENMGEKHVPFIEYRGDESLIRIGKLQHPMVEEHYVTFIEAISEDNKYLKRKYLQSGDVPEMILRGNHKNIKGREYCNIHGLWANYKD